MHKCGALGETITESVFKSVTQVQQQANAYALCAPNRQPCIGISFIIMYSHAKFCTLQHLYYTLYMFQCMHVNLKSCDLLLALTFPSKFQSGKKLNLRYNDLALITMEFWKAMVQPL